ncbi:hypothetical protein [Legionella nagasakiensis]|uniref:hypothetical protein n=1 Tax=Legionella nagasakiensis TaxID=535290 RepID=UPI0010551141|nr:hypothetical protein [Legionella nagasakiensis]
MKPKLSLVALALFNATASYANLLSSYPVSAYPARATGQFLAGDEQQLGGFGDLMIPLLGNERRIFFTDGTILLGQNQRATYSGGVGYREIKEMRFGTGVIGAFAFADYYRTSLKNQFWQLNPGLEWLTARYEARLQGYIPLSSRNQGYLNTFASMIPQSVIADSGRANHLAGATGHTIFDTPVRLVEELGTGVELEVGRFIDYGQGAWARVGGYHFNYRNSKNINGVEANVELAVNRRTSLILQDNYDNQNKNRFSVGLRVNLGGADAPRNTLQYQMTSPIIRHVARQSYGEAAPLRQNFQATGSSFNLFDNVWFFSPSGAYPPGANTTLANCTAENPCLTIDTATAEQIAALTPNANLFFESGNYLIPANSPRWANLQDGQSVWGRNIGWLTPAFGNDRPLIQGGLVWGNFNTIENGAAYNIRVLNNNQVIGDGVGLDSTVVGLYATGNLEVNDSDIQAFSDAGNRSATGVGVGLNLTISRSAVTAMAHGDGNGENADAVAAVAGGEIIVNNSTIIGEATGDALNAGTARAFGVNASSITVNQSIVTTETRGNANNGLTDSYGVAGGEITINHSTVTSQTSGNVDDGAAARALAVAAFGGNAIVSDSTILAETNGNAINGGNTIAFGIYAEIGNVLVSQATVTARTSGNVDGGFASAIGILAFNGNATINDSTITAETTGNAINGGIADAVGISANGVVTFEGGAASFVTAIAQNGDETAVQALIINNDSNPPSQCSTNGVDFNDC